MNKLLRVLILLVLPLSGCIGAQQFSCSGLPEGTRCLSVKEAYRSTNGNHYNNDNQEDLVHVDTASKIITVPEQAVRSLDGSHAVPIRVPAQIMRVWYGPYEGTDGQSSFMPGFGYIELVARKWEFTSPSKATSGRRIKPLTVTTPILDHGGRPQPAGLNDQQINLPSKQKGTSTTKEKKR